MVTIGFSTQEWKQVCIRYEAAQAHFDSAQVATDLMTFLAEAEAIEDAAALLEFRDGQNTEGDSLSFPISSNYRATLIAVGKEPKRDENGEIEWGSVQHMMLVEIIKC